MSQTKLILLNWPSLACDSGLEYWEISQFKIIRKNRRREREEKEEMEEKKKNEKEKLM